MTCETITHLKSLIDGTDQDVKVAAVHTLDIISDIQETELNEISIQCLHYLVDAIYQRSQASLFAHLHEGAPDCAVCAALKARLAVQSV